MNEIQEEEKRPTGLLVLFILTTIYTSLKLLGAIGSLLSGPPNAQEMKLIKVEMAKSMKAAKDLNSEYLVDFIEKMGVISDATLANFMLFNFLSFLFYGLGLAAAILMFKRMKLGFHLYIGYSFILLIQYYFIVSPSDVPLSLLIMEGLLSLLFIFLYSRYLNWMKVNEFEKVD